MKKVAAFLMIPALVLLVVATASAQEAIRGTYAMMATGDCLHSNHPFVNAIM